MEIRFMFFVSCIAYMIVLISGANVTCSVKFSSYICQHIAKMADFPTSLPANIQTVTLFGTNKLTQSFPNKLFRNPSWSNVFKLSVLEFNSIELIEEDFLDGLDNLKFLSISSCPKLNKIHPDIFNSTPDLEALHLDGNHYLKLSVVEQALNGKLHKLKYLSLVEIEAVKGRVVLGENYTNALSTKNITYLDISGVKTIIVDHGSVQNILSNVKYLNVSHSTLLSADGIQLKDSYFRNIEFLDLTSSSSVGQLSILPEDSTFTRVLWKNVKYFFAQQMMDPLIQVRVNARFTFENYVQLSLNVFDFSQNNIMVFNITFNGKYDFSALETLNLSSNNLEYISPSFLGSFPSLKILDQSNNQLHKMQNMDDFSYLFSGNKDLEIIYLHKNYLSVVPSKLFSSNTKLRVIDLSDNELMHFNIDLHNTWNLTLINLRKNRLKRLPPTFMEQLEQTFIHKDTAEKDETYMINILLNQIQDKNLLAEKYKYGYNASDTISLKQVSEIIPQNLTLNVLDNPLICDCDTLDFVKWIVSTDIVIVNRTILTCKYNNNEALLNSAVLEMLRHNCRIVLIIGIGIVSSVAIIVSIFAFGIAIHRKLRKARLNQELEFLKNEILDDNTHFRFVAFLSYCSRDSNIVENYILTPLNTLLRDIFKTDKDLVSTGADSFIPGKLITEEIHRCINESLVIIPVITPAFLESHWCLTECVNAIERHRQVLVLMEKHTDTSDTIATIRNQIGQYTRASWSYQEGQFHICPSWDTICDGVIQRAIESFRNHRNRHCNEAIELARLLDH
ncbi:hypothetical protein ACJMK2_001036 [Sinanodonta woodiana]|uniref:TIR domain-containing protein n=1 Tax=Sinanodonta woodiana TaxID=1069815 RepID=A0ABD3XRJ1_SINWO